MARELILMAVPRTVLGKQVKALRREGLVPAVVYGPAVEATIQISVVRKELERFYQAHGQSTLFTVNWGEGSQQVFIKEVQVEPVRRAPLHVDFFAPNLMKELTARVHVAFHHFSDLAEGVLTTAVSEVEVRALPAEIPHQLDADIAHLLAAHDSFRAGDLKLPKGVTLITDPEIVLATLVAQVVEASADTETRVETVAGSGTAPTEAADAGKTE